MHFFTPFKEVTESGREKAHGSRQPLLSGVLHPVSMKITAFCISYFFTWFVIRYNFEKKLTSCYFIACKITYEVLLQLSPCTWLESITTTRRKKKAFDGFKIT